MKMEYVELGDVCDLKNGFAFKSKDYVEISNTLSCRMSSIRPGGKFDLYHNQKFLPDSFTETYSDYLLYDGDIVIAMTDLAGDPKILGVPTIVNTDGKNLLQNQRVGKLIVKDKTKVSTSFLQYVLNRPVNKSYYKKFASGGLQINVGKKEILGNKIPFPPLEEQKRIAELLDEADRLRQLNKALIEKYDALTQSLFLDMFGDPVTNPKGWEKVETIKNASSIVPGRNKPKSFTGNIPWVTTADLTHLGITKKSKKNIGLTENEILEARAKLIPEGSVIMTCVGDLGIISINKNPIIINQQLHAFQCEEKLNNIFLMYSLSFQTGYMYKMASSTTVPYMNKTVSNNVPTIVPPIALQNQFAERVAIIEQQKQQAQEALQKSEDLFNGLLQDVFRRE